MPVKVASHENSSTTLIRRTLSTKSANFAIFIHLIVFQHSQLNLLPLMLILLGSGVRLLCKINYFTISLNSELIWQLYFFTFARPQ